MQIPGINSPAARILTNEGIAPSQHLPLNAFKSNELVNSALGLFGFLPAENDARWHIADAAQKAKSQNHLLRGLHFEAARQSIYLSSTETLRNEIAHYARVVQNLGSIDLIS